MGGTKETLQLSPQIHFLLRGIERRNCVSIDHANVLQAAFATQAACTQETMTSLETQLSDLGAIVRTLFLQPGTPSKKPAPNKVNSKSADTNPTGVSKSTGGNNSTFTNSNCNNKSYAKADAAGRADQEFEAVQKKRRWSPHSLTSDPFASAASL